MSPWTLVVSVSIGATGIVDSCWSRLASSTSAFRGQSRLGSVLAEERITYEQVQRAMKEMPDLVEIIRWLRPQVEDIQRNGTRNVRHDRLNGTKVGLHWDRGN